jgi:hypothetical protein
MLKNGLAVAIRYYIPLFIKIHLIICRAIASFTSVIFSEAQKGSAVPTAFFHSPLCAEASECQTRD